MTRPSDLAVAPPGSPLSKDGAVLALREAGWRYRGVPVAAWPDTRM